MANNNFCKDILTQLGTNCGLPCSKPVSFQKGIVAGHFKGYQMSIDMQNGYNALIAVSVEQTNSAILINGVVRSVERNEKNRPREERYLDATTLPSNTAISFIYDTVCQYYKQCCALAQSMVEFGASPYAVCEKIMEEMKRDRNFTNEPVKMEIRLHEGSRYRCFSVKLPAMYGYTVKLELGASEQYYCITGSIVRAKPKTDKSTRRYDTIKSFNPCFLPISTRQADLYYKVSDYFNSCYRETQYLG